MVNLFSSFHPVYLSLLGTSDFFYLLVLASEMYFLSPKYVASTIVYYASFPVFPLRFMFPYLLHLSVPIFILFLLSFLQPSFSHFLSSSSPFTFIQYGCPVALITSLLRFHSRSLALRGTCRIYWTLQRDSIEPLEWLKRRSGT